VVCLPTRQVDQLRDQLPTLEIVAGETAVAIERHNLMIRLATEADTDGLTGARNRRAWESGLPKALQRASQSGLPVTVVLLDLDHFKAFNDTFGHPTGDALLREVVQAWQARLRPGDLLARYGGEEFAVLLQECTIDDAHTVAESLRALMPRGQTCSAGAATWDGIESAGGLVERADRALYEAKRSGRNQLVVA
jgi:diguanylate cyclase (GGDEF)-like protein